MNYSKNGFTYTQERSNNPSLRLTSILLKTPLIMGCVSGADIADALVVTPLAEVTFSSSSPHLLVSINFVHLAKVHIRN